MTAYLAHLACASGVTTAAITAQSKEGHRQIGTRGARVRAPELVLALKQRVGALHAAVLVQRIIGYAGCRGDVPHAVVITVVVAAGQAHSAERQGSQACDTQPRKGGLQRVRSST